MKKFYTLALGVLTVISASALERRQPAMVNMPSPSVRVERSVKVMPVPDINTSSKAKVNPTSIQDYEGDYVWTCTSLLTGNTLSNEVVLVVTDAELGKVELSGIFAYGSIPATLDVATGTLSIANKTYVGQDADGPLYFYLKDLNSTGSDFEPGANSRPYTSAKLTNGVFSFDASDLWAVGDPDQESLGFYSFSYDNKLTVVPDDSNPNYGWTSLGMATFQDGWLLPAFGVDQTQKENWYEVELQQNDTDKNIYRLVDPYRGNFPYADTNKSTTKHGYIQFNVSDPDHVYFDAVDAGYANSEFQLVKFYCFNGMTYCMGNFNATPAEVIAMLGNDTTWTTFKDGVLTVPCEYNSTEGQWESDAVFGDQTNKYGGWVWNADSKPVNMEAKIIFPTNTPGSVDGINSENNAPVVYYNLQGARVDNPSGGLYIRTQGSKVTKVFVK